MSDSSIFPPNIRKDLDRLTAKLKEAAAESDAEFEAEQAERERAIAASVAEMKADPVGWRLRQLEKVVESEHELKQILDERGWEWRGGKIRDKKTGRVVKCGTQKRCTSDDDFPSEGGSSYTRIVHTGKAKRPDESMSEPPPPPTKNERKRSAKKRKS
jgi:hypothetical protein